MSSLVSDLRRSRKSPAVLKAQIIGIRSREKTKPIFIFEGFEDVGPYCVWISRCNNALVFETLPASGKDQVLTFKAKIESHETYLSEGIYFFVDRDFDDLKGHSQSPNLFLTEKYSIENYLVSKCVLTSILIDEFKCAGEQIERALVLFSATLQNFLEGMSPANRRIFYARRLAIGLTGSGIENRLTKYVATELERVRVVASTEDLKNLIPLAREPTVEDQEQINPIFDALDSTSRHRGKFILAFFLKWLELLAEERRTGVKGIFDKSIQLHFSPQQLSMRSLATRSDLPLGLGDFLSQVGK